MKKVEITEHLELNGSEQFKIYLHSFYNILTVVIGQVEILRTLMKDPHAFPGFHAIVDNFKQSLVSREKTLSQFKRIESFNTAIADIVEGEKPKIEKLSEENKVYAMESLTTFSHILDIVRLRAEEFLIGVKLDLEWKEFEIAILEKKLKQVFDTIAENSHGRYGIVYNENEKGDKDYLIDFKFASSKAGKITIPVFLHDVTRDLTANARKYTPIGGNITTELTDDGSSVTLKVTDNGRGIPESEIPKVASYGYRASNTTAKETAGDGFGLTKAYFICKRHSGRMWIASELDKGTEITLEIPVP